MPLLPSFVCSHRSRYHSNDLLRKFHLSAVHVSLQALEGGGAKNINFQELAADLAQITFDYPFR
jgi:hypothetical protein